MKHEGKSSNGSNAATFRKKLALLAGAQEIASDPATLDLLRAGIAELKAGHVPAPVPDNVVELFPAKQG